jgi:uncharacterized protein YigE (DUF2233 family)
MKKKTKIKVIITIILVIIGCIFIYQYKHPGPPNIISESFNPKEVNISLYWKNHDGEVFENIGELNEDLESKGEKLLFATNGGMFDESFHPMGLYIENGKTIKPLNTKTLNHHIPNFYLQPNGVFYISDDNQAGICVTAKFSKHLNAKYATQSGPMLLVNGEINPIFEPKSTNFEIRNGVGILPNNEIIFAISKNRVRFYDFAKYFKDKGCINALFLDAYVSKAYDPSQDIHQTGGELGVLIGVTKKH